MKLSFVFCISDLAYGGDFCQRVQRCLDNLYYLGQDCPFEVVIVELEGAGVYDSIHWRPTLPTRIITVPRKIHDGLPNPHGEKYFEYWCKNIGIRRALGEFILSTNPDNVYSPELIQRLAGPLDPECFYRVDRTDVRDGKVISVNKNTGTYYPDGSNTENERTHGDPNGLHFNAAGDFVLMHRDAWAKIKGHPEVPYSLTVDGETVYLATQAGLTQIILPEKMLHHDHSRTDKYAPEWSDRNPHGNMNPQESWGLAGYVLDERTV